MVGSWRCGVLGRIHGVAMCCRLDVAAMIVLTQPTSGWDAVVSCPSATATPRVWHVGFLYLSPKMAQQSISFHAPAAAAGAAGSRKRASGTGKAV